MSPKDSAQAPQVDRVPWRGTLRLPRCCAAVLVLSLLVAVTALSLAGDTSPG
jgi:hypothetical protein